MTEPQPPHEALSLVLAYLNLFELLSMTEVCTALRDTINGDVLLWLHIAVEPPLNLRISDETLLKICSKAKGRLRALALMNCVRITDDGLDRVIQNNPQINKLYVPGCTGLTPDGIVRIVKNLTQHNNHHSLEHIKLHGLYNITKDHLQLLNSYLNVNPMQEQGNQCHMYLDYNQQLPNLQIDRVDRPIDVEVCPKCSEVRLVFDCPRENCKMKETKQVLMECRGCCFCIPRCEGCGGCVASEEGFEETVCLDVLCLECWLKLPKCNMCNKPYCNRHADKHGWNAREGFVCDVCMLKTVGDVDTMTDVD